MSNEEESAPQFKSQGAGGRTKLSLRRKKDKDSATQRPPPSKKATDNTTLRLTPYNNPLEHKGSKDVAKPVDDGGDIIDRDANTDTQTSTQSVVGEIDNKSLTDDRLCPVGDEDCEDDLSKELTGVESSSRQLEAGLGDYYFCHICQKNLTRFNDVRREQHINRCCNELEEGEKVAANKSEGKRSKLSCPLCEKSLKTENARVTHMKACAKTKGVAPDRLVQILRESKDNVSSTEGCPSSSRLDGEREEECLQTKKSKRLTTQSQTGPEADLSTSKGDKDFTMPPPSAPARRGRKRKRDNLQENYLEELETDQLQLALAISASMDQAAAGATTFEGQFTDTIQEKGKKRQKSRKKAVPQVVPPLLTVTTQQAQNIVSKRAEEILQHSETERGCGALEGDDCEIPCTPAFQESELGGINPPPSSPPLTGATFGERRDSSEDLLFLLEEGKDLPELVDVVAVKGGTCQANSDSLDKVHVHDGEVVGGGDAVEPMDCVTVTKTEAGGDEGHPLDNDDMEHSTAGRAAGTAEELTVSFSDDLCDVDYPTLWELTSGEKEDIENYYVPALSSLVSPRKAGHSVCRVCAVEPCLALTLLDQPTSPTQSLCHGQPSTSAVSVREEDMRGKTTTMNHISADTTFCDLLSDMKALVGSSLLSDVQIHTQSGSVIPAHAVILAARSPPLRKVIEQSQSFPISLDFSEFDEASIKAFLRFIYTGSTPSESDDNSHLRQTLSLLIQRWYGDRRSGREIDNSHFEPVHQNSLPQRPMVNCPQTNFADQSTLIYHDGEIELTSSRLYVHEDSESRTPPPLLDQDSPTAEPYRDDPVIIESSPSSDETIVDVESGATPTKDLPQAHQSGSEEDKDSINVQDMDTGSPAVRLRSSSPTKPRDSEAFTDNVHVDDSTLAHIDEPEEGSPQVQKDCCAVKQDSGERVSGRSSRESSHADSHISLSSYNSSDLLCETPAYFMSPQDDKKDNSSSSSELFCTSLNQDMDDKRVDRVSEGEKGAGIEKSNSLIVDTEAVVDSVLVESSDSHTFSLDVVTLTSDEKKKEGSPNEALHSFCIPDYSPVGDYSFGAFDDGLSNLQPTVEGTPSPPTNIDYSPPPQENTLYSTSPQGDISFPPDNPEDIRNLSKTPEEQDLLKLITPINKKTITIATGTMETVKRKSHDFRTPANSRCELQTDDDITPLPDFKGMRTPYLKGECARFGVKAMAKKKMIAKLHEIYEHTHPLVDEEGKVVTADTESSEGGGVKGKATKQEKVADKTRGKTGRRKKAVTKEGATVSEETATQAGGDLKTEVLDYLKSDKQLYQDILLYKPLELSHFHTKLKSAGVSVTKDRLPDILDNFCVTYTLPRQQRLVKRSKAKHV